MPNRSHGSQRVLVGLPLSSLLVIATPALADLQMLRLVPCDGIGSFAKEFEVPLGTIIRGVRFSNHDPASVFPEVVFCEGTVLSSSTSPIRSAYGAREGAARGLVTVLWGDPVIADTGRYHAIIRLPRELDPTRVPRIGSTSAESPTGSYVLNSPSRFALDLGVSLDIQLLTEVTGKVAAGDDLDEPARAVSQARATLTLTTAYQADASAVLLLTLPTSGAIEAAVYDVRGRHVRSLKPKAVVSPGAHRLEWDGTDVARHPVACGVYFVQVTTGTERLVRNVVVR